LSIVTLNIRVSSETGIIFYQGNIQTDLFKRKATMKGLRELKVG